MPWRTRGSGTEAAIDPTRLVAGMARDRSLTEPPRWARRGATGDVPVVEGPQGRRTAGAVDGQRIEVCAARPLIVRGPRPIKGAQARSPTYHQALTANRPPCRNRRTTGAAAARTIGERDEIKHGSRTRGARQERARATVEPRPPSAGPASGLGQTQAPPSSWAGQLRAQIVSCSVSREKSGLWGDERIFAGGSTFSGTVAGGSQDGYCFTGSSGARRVFFRVTSLKPQRSEGKRV